MSSISTSFTDERQGKAEVPAVGVDYIPTEEEKRIFKECNRESLIYRALPFSVVSIAVTQALISRGTLAPSPRFGPLPKLAFAGVCGYLAGKMSYMKTCQEKFKKLEHSPLGEVLRQRTRFPPLSQGPRSEMSDPDTQSFDTMFQAADTEAPPHPRDYGYSKEMQMSQDDDLSLPAESNVPAEDPTRKSVLYENLRNRNRENYEVTLTQKAESTLKPTPSSRAAPPSQDPAKKNMYGDAWDE